MTLPIRRASLARAAVAIAALTVLSRLAGFARSTAFSRKVGSGCVGSVYQTANAIPNIVFDIVAGGMLSALVVPLLAPALHRGDRAEANALVSALLSWAVVLLVPLTVIVAVFARPIVSVLLGSGPCAGADAEALGARMLVVFAPQVLLYGLGVVLAGVLTASERFTWPALAPLLSSLVVIATYLAFGLQASAGIDVPALSHGSEYLLSGGTTAGVAVLTLCLIPVVWRTGVRVRPTLRFPTRLAGSVRTSAWGGAATLAATELSTAVMIALANRHSPRGTVVIVTMAQTVFLLPWAVLSLPIATTTFPRLAAAWQAGDVSDVRRRLGGALDVLVAAAAGGTAVLVAVATPAGLLLFGRDAPSLGQFAPAATAFGLGLVGWSLVALLARALYATGHVPVAAVAQVGGQLVVIVADVVLSAALPTSDRALALGLGNSVGVLVAAGLLLAAAARARLLVLNGPWWRRLAIGGGCAAAGAVAGWAIGRRAGTTLLSAGSTGVTAAVVAAAVYVGLLALLDRAAVARLRTLLPRAGA